MKKIKELSILMPCLNEEDSIPICLAKIRKQLNKINIKYEVLVIDNGSSDNSNKIATNLGAKVINQKKRGYGNALRLGIKKAQYDNIIFADSDNSYNFDELKKFITLLSKGYDFVIGCRFKKYGGEIQKGAMPILHQYIGNPIFSFLTKFFFNIKINDVYCGYRAFKKKNFLKKKYYCGQMDFAIEHAIKCYKSSLNPTEVPIKLHKDSRINSKSHLRTFSDGLKTLKLLLIFSPNFFLIFPGLIMILISFIMPLYFNSFITINFNIYASYFIPSILYLGIQFIYLGYFSKRLANYLEFRNDEISLNSENIINILYFISLFLIFLTIIFQIKFYDFFIDKIVQPYSFFYLGILMFINTSFLNFFKYFEKY